MSAPVFRSLGSKKVNFKLRSLGIVQLGEKNEWLRATIKWFCEFHIDMLRRTL